MLKCHAFYVFDGSGIPDGNLSQSATLVFRVVGRPRSTGDLFCDICDVRERIANIAAETRTTCIEDDPELEQLGKDLLDSVRRYRVAKRAKARDMDNQ